MKSITILGGLAAVVGGVVLLSLYDNAQSTATSSPLPTTASGLSGGLFSGLGNIVGELTSSNTANTGNILSGLDAMLNSANNTILSNTKSLNSTNTINTGNILSALNNLTNSTNSNLSNILNSQNARLQDYLSAGLNNITNSNLSVSVQAEISTLEKQLLTEQQALSKQLSSAAKSASGAANPFFSPSAQNYNFNTSADKTLLSSLQKVTPSDTIVNTPSTNYQYNGGNSGSFNMSTLQNNLHSGSSGSSTSSQSGLSGFFNTLSSFNPSNSITNAVSSAQNTINNITHSASNTLNSAVQQTSAYKTTSAIQNTANNINTAKEISSVVAPLSFGAIGVPFAAQSLSNIISTPINNFSNSVSKALSGTNIFGFKL
jgi:hypothetical protein